MVPAWFLLSKMGVSPIIAPSVTLQNSGELHQRWIIPSWNSCFCLYRISEQSSKVHLLTVRQGYQQRHPLTLQGTFQEDPACSHSTPSHYWKYFKTLPREVRPQPWTPSKEEIGGSSPFWFSKHHGSQTAPDRGTAYCGVMSVGAAVFQIIHLIRYSLLASSSSSPSWFDLLNELQP